MSADTLRAVWKAELDRLELEVLRVERLLDGEGPLPADAWTPPAVLGPMPEDFGPRARDLLDRQDRAGAALRAALVSAQKQLAYGTRVSDATTAGRAHPVYVDLQA